MFDFATKLSPEVDRLARARDAGFAAAEFWLDATRLESVEEMVEMAATFPLRFVPHFPNRDNLDDTHLENFVRLYRELRCRAAVIHKPMLRSYGRKLQQIAGDGLVLAVENGRQRGAFFDNWARDHRDLTLDVEHLWKYTLGDCSLGEFARVLGGFLAEHGPRVRHVHMPGYVPGAPEHRPAYTNPEFAECVWEALESCGFDGFAVSELDVEFQSDTHLRRDRILFDRWKARRDAETYAI